MEEIAGLDAIPGRAIGSNNELLVKGLTSGVQKNVEISTELNSRNINSKGATDCPDQTGIRDEEITKAIG